ncbi:uncharacterized protein LOC114327287 [Diabrotica virgifera virgifera]|uniref:DUF4806 domain-containing protein n=1 Tax=Diabrotica virgifera virgifera TaxID=50390 RepID=A0ABM5IFJ3_DIAVI|nr:uncharacterized protein LOC114327287 [Diabrotica virgifera virgifera]
MEDIYFINNEIKNNNDKWKSLVSCLASLGGDTVVSRTNRILKHLITDSVAKGFNFRGRNDKAAFNILEFYKIIIYVVKSKITTAQEIDIEQAIKNWLKHAPQREKVRNNKAENQV